MTWNNGILPFRGSRLSRWQYWSVSTHPPSCWRETPAPGRPRGPRSAPGSPSMFWWRWLCPVSDPTALYEVWPETGASPGPTSARLSRPPLSSSLTRRQGWSHRKPWHCIVITSHHKVQPTCSQMWGCDSPAWLTVCRAAPCRQILGLQWNVMRLLNIIIS